MLRLSKSVALIGFALFLCSQTVNGQQRQFRPAISNGNVTPPAVNNSIPESSPFQRPIYVATNPNGSPPVLTGDMVLSQPINTTESLSVNPPTEEEPADRKNVEIDLTVLLNGEPIVTTTTASNPEPDEPADAVAASVDQAAQDIGAKLTSAMNGDKDAIRSLVIDYLLPVFAIIAVMIVANWIANYFRDVVNRIVSSRVDVTLGRFAGNLTRLLVLAVATIGVLSYFKIETTSLAAGIAALGLVIGMALQGTLGNFAAGIALLIFRPFNVGDYIVVDDEEGTVSAIELFTTTIDTLDNRHVIIPNDNVFGNKIQNWSHNSERRVDVLVGVAYDADMKQTRRVLLDALQTIEGRVLEREPQTYLAELNASSVDWSCRVWAHPSDYLAVKERVTEAVKDALDQHGIGIPFPQLDLHVIAAAAQQKMAA